jgi:hypothetical protein
MPPACRVGPLPNIFLVPWPWQAPGNWAFFLLFAACSALLFGALAYRQRRAGPIVWSARRRYTAGVGALGYFLQLASGFWFALIALPLYDRIGAWTDATLAPYLTVTPCNLRAFDTVSIGLNHTASLFIGVALGTFSLGRLIVIVTARIWRLQDAPLQQQT